MVINKLAMMVVSTGLVTLGAAGCKWTEFDDLEKLAWVSSTERPNGDSSDYGVAIQRGNLTSASGGKLVVIGTGDAQYTELVYSSTGDVELAPTALKLNSQFGVGNLDIQPILLANPTSDEVALLANTGGNQVSALIGAGGLNPFTAFGPNRADAATYMKPPPRLDLAGDPPVQPIVGEGTFVYGTWVANRPGAMQVKCQLQDAAAADIVIRGLGAAPIAQATSDDLVVWTETGKLILYPGGAYNGQDPFGPCTGGVLGPLAGSVEVDTGFLPGLGSQIVMIEGRYAVLVGHRAMAGTESYLAVYDVLAMNATPALEPAAIGTPVTQPGLRTAAYLQIDADRYVVAGYPDATVDGANAGHVLVFPLNLTTGLAATPVLTLHDAQPENNQAFGRAITVTPFNGKPVIAVAASNEVFLYYRTTLYGETRDGQ